MRVLFSILFCIVFAPALAQRNAGRSDEAAIRELVSKYLNPLSMA